MAYKIRYQKGYKYQLVDTYFGVTKITGYEIDYKFIKLTHNGQLTIRAGFAFDGPSGPTWDDRTNMRGACAHDAKYQLMRLGLIPQSYRAIVDIELKEDCLEDGMGRFRAWYYFQGVDHFAAYAARYGTEPTIYEAP